MFARRLQVIGFFFAALDAVAAVAAFTAAYWLRDALAPRWAAQFPSLPAGPLLPFGQYAVLLVGMVAIWMATGYLLGLYRARELRQRRQAVLDPTVQAVASVVVLGAALFFAQFRVQEFPVSRLLLVGFVLLNWVLQVGLRLAFLEWGPRWRERLGGTDNVLVVGTGPAAQELVQLIEESRRAGFRMVGFVDPSGRAAPPTGPGSAYPVWGVAEVPRLLQEEVVDEVFFAVSKEELGELEDLLLLFEEEGVRTRLQLKIFPHLLSRVYVEQFRSVPLLTFTTTPENELHLAFKRLLDVVGAAVLLVLLAPAFLLIALLVRLTSPGPALYRQVRCGVGGRRFTLYKFRSMVVNAHERRGELADRNEADGPVFKMAHDPRCTPVGRWLRRLSLDELPQLWNVLRGDMSFVGPRPPLPEEVEQYQHWQRRRLRMRPGLTCLWALEGRSRISFDRWMKLDLTYIDNWSLWLDLKIALKTIPLVLSGRGSA